MAKRGPSSWKFCLRLLSFAYILEIVVAPNALAQTPTPTTSGYRGATQVSAYQGAFADLALEIDRFWAQSFSESGKPYSQPGIIVVDRLILTACGPVEPVPNAFYCSSDRTLYLVPQFLAELDTMYGDFAPITVLGHEWGHHVQELLGLRKVKSLTFELQADCLTGVFSRHAQNANLLDADDLNEAVDTAISGGDPIFVHEDEPDAHGRSSDRVIAFMEGYYEGAIEGCGVPLVPTHSGPDQTADGTGDSGENSGQPRESPTIVDSPRLPTVLPLAHARCFSIVDGAPLSFSQLVDRFSGFPDASARLQDWGWHASAFRQFGCDGPPEGEAGWIDISVHGFSSAGSAHEAADYFAAARLDGTSLRRTDGPGVGDYSIALVGPASNGTEFTIYATRGPWLVRVTGVSPSGIPFMNVRRVATDVLAAQDLGGMTSSAPPVLDTTATAPVWSSADFLPQAPNVNYAACFQTHSRGSYAAREVDEAFAATGIGVSATATYGWRDGAYVVFMCDDPPFGRARQLDVVIHQFRDDAAAGQVLPYVDAFFVAGDHASRACDSAGPLVICVTGYADTGSPLSDVHFVLNQVVASAR